MCDNDWAMNSKTLFCAEGLNAQSTNIKYMKTTVEIEWDTPKEQEWLCADNISVALSEHCKNTKFKVKEVCNCNCQGSEENCVNLKK